MGSGIHAPLSGNKYILSIRPTQLSSHHSCRQERRGDKDGGTDIVVLAIYHLARGRSTPRARPSPPRDFHNRDPSFPFDSFHSSRFFLILVNAARTDVRLVIGVIVHAHTSGGEENAQCPGGVWPMRCPVRKTLQDDLLVRTHRPALPFFPLGISFRRRCINSVERLTGKKIQCSFMG